MKIVVLVEGDTEAMTLKSFFWRWLDANGLGHVGVCPVKFRGCGHYIQEYAKKTHLYLSTPGVIGVVGLLDLYGLTHPVAKSGTVAERYTKTKAALERPVSGDFRQHFAVHELEAWLLSDPALFKPSLRSKLPKKPPEEVNFGTPPAKVLEKHYPKACGCDYKKTTDGRTLFQKLDPAQAAAKCPYLKLLLDDLLDMARKSAKSDAAANPGAPPPRRAAKHPRGGTQG